MSQQKWFYELLTEEFGPVSAEQIRDMVSDGTLASSDRVRQDNSETWITVSQMPDLTSDDNDAAGELTDLSELSFAFENGEATIDQEPTTEEPDIDSFNVQGDSEAAEQSRVDQDSPIDDMGIDSFRIEGDGDSELPAAARAEASGPQYFVESLGQMLGPMPLAELVQMAESGVLTESDRVRRTDESAWGSPLNIEEAASALQQAARDTGDGDEPAREIGAVTARRLQADTPAEPAEAPDSKTPEKTTPEEKPETKKEEPPKKTKSKKRKREPKKDEFLQEIFSEVFTEDGSVREDRLTASPTSPTAPAASGASASPAAAAPAGSPAASPQPAVPKPPPPPPPRPAFKPPAKSKKSGSGFSFPMPPPKILAMIGGGVVLLAVVVAAFTGMMSVPGVAPDVDGFLKSVVAEYKALQGGPVPADKWAALKKRVSDEGRPIISYFSQRGDLTEEENKKRWGVVKLIELFNCGSGETEKQEKIFGDFEKLGAI